MKQQFKRFLTAILLATLMLTGCASETSTKSEPKTNEGAKEKKTEKLTVFLIRNGEKTAVRKRPSRGLLAGLYEFPNTAGELDDKEAAAWLRKNHVEPIRIRRICDADHVFTHKKWFMRGYEVITDSFAERPIPFIMADPEEIDDKYCIPSAFSRYSQWLKAAKNGKYSYTAE